MDIYQAIQNPEPARTMQSGSLRERAIEELVAPIDDARTIRISEIMIASIDSASSVRVGPGRPVCDELGVWPLVEATPGGERHITIIVGTKEKAENVAEALNGALARGEKEFRLE